VVARRGSERRKVPVQSSVFGSVPPHIDARAAVFLLTPLHTPLGQSLDDHCAGRGRTCPAAAITIRRRSGGARASRGASCRTDEATCLGENHRCRSTWLAMKSKRVLPRVAGTRAARIAARIHQSVGRSSLDRAPSSTTVARDDRCRRAWRSRAECALTSDRSAEGGVERMRLPIRIHGKRGKTDGRKRRERWKR
jgi:hypothetical protein